MTYFSKLFKREPVQNYSDFWNWFVQHEKAFFKVVKSGQDLEKKFFNKLSPKTCRIARRIFFSNRNVR